MGGEIDLVRPLRQRPPEADSGEAGGVAGQEEAVLLSLSEHIR